MPNADKIAAMQRQADPHIRTQLLTGLTRPSPTTNEVRTHSAMHYGSVAAALAVLPDNDAVPRVIRQFTSIFLVSRAGELWRVYDADAPSSVDPQMPCAGSQLACRLFVALARNEQLRVHRFVESELRDIDPAALQAQLDDSQPA